MEHTPILPPGLASAANGAAALSQGLQAADALSGLPTAFLTTDVVIVPRAVLAQITEALAAIVQVSGEGFSLLVDRLDQHDGDPDTEDDDPAEDDGTGQDAAYVEWTTMRGSQKGGPNLLAGHEDHEEDDAPEEDDPSGQCDEDGINTQHDLMRYTPGAHGPGCPIADPGGY